MLFVSATETSLGLPFLQLKVFFEFVIDVGVLPHAVSDKVGPQLISFGAEVSAVFSVLLEASVDAEGPFVAPPALGSLPAPPVAAFTLYCFCCVVGHIVVWFLAL